LECLSSGVFGRGNRSSEIIRKKRHVPVSAAMNSGIQLASPCMRHGFRNKKPFARRAFGGAEDLRGFEKS